MMLEWFVEPFALGFQQRALLGGILAGLMCAVVGTWLVLRGMSFFGDAFVHGVVPGIAAAVVLDVSPALGAAVAAAVMVAGIEIVSRQTRLTEDTAMTWTTVRARLTTNPDEVAPSADETARDLCGPAAGAPRARDDQRRVGLQRFR